MSPHLLRHPVFDHGDASTRIGNPKVVHPASHKIGLIVLITFPTGRLRFLLKTSRSLSNSAVRFFSVGA
jgi:hypothetical protein